MTRFGHSSAAVEGPCCAGKTTLCTCLLERFGNRRVAGIADYAAFVGGGRYLPAAVPKSLEEERLALRTFLDIEHNRLRRARRGGDQFDFVLIDRSVHTLLAHAYALVSVTGLDHFRLALSELGRSLIPCWPGLVIYLDALPETVRLRNRGKFAAGSIFVDRQFNAGIRNYFMLLGKAGRPRVVWLDASLAPDTLCDQAKCAFDSWHAGSRGARG